MKPKTMILMALAVICGLGASYMTSRLLAERQPVEQDKVKILVARRILSVGERITKPEEFFEIKEVTKENDPPDAIKDFEALKGKRLKQTRNKGDHITAGNLYDGGLDIPEGYQAVGLPVNLATTVSGLASLPGNRVDLILTVRGRDIQDTAAITILQNVLVLAADGRTTRDGEQVAPASVVTFALREQDKLTVTAAKDMGILTLSLRKLDDMSTAKITRRTGKEILTGKTEEKPATVAQAPPPPPPVVVAPPPPPPVVEEPKFTVHSQLIINGERIQRSTYRRLENGEIQADDGTSPSPAPRQPQRPQGQQGKGLPGEL